MIYDDGSANNKDHKNLEAIDKCEYYRERYNNCGFGTWRPKWLQCLATPEMFLLNFSLVAIFQGATFTYLIGSLSTLEKRYSFESKVSAYILIADNISQMFVSPVVGYLGTKYNRPRIMAMGEIISAFACFLYATPYFIYGPATHRLHASIGDNLTDYQLCDLNKTHNECNVTTVWPAVMLLWFASFINGIGYTAFYTIGLPYLDDNTSKKKSALYLSATAALRLCGPSLGLLLSSLSLSYYENPTYHPLIAKNDPRWVGAWWFGFIIIGICLILFSIPLSMFPKQMLKRPISSKQKNEITIKLSTEAWVTFKRLMSNPIFVFHMLGVAVRLIGYLGYYIFKPKYIEAQFRKSASDAAFWTGFTSVPTMAVGIFAGGIVLTKLRPQPRNVAFYIFGVELIITMIVLCAKSLTCDPPIFPQTQFYGENLKLDNLCNSACGCNTKVFHPVCGDDRVSNYFSPCYAGCTSSSIDAHNDKHRIFSNCNCLEAKGGVVTNGYCDNNCSQFTKYIALLAIAGIISSTAKIGDTLITLRCIDPQDKSFAMGILGSFFAIFAFIPYPLIFGAITDSACMVWKESCGSTGNCWLYNIDKFNSYLHNAAFSFMIVGALLHLVVVFYSYRIKNMFDDNDDSESECRTDDTCTLIVNNECNDSDFSDNNSESRFEKLNKQR